MKGKQFFLYAALEALLFLALLVFQIIAASNGYYIFQKDAINGLAIGILQVSITAASFLYAIYQFFVYRDRNKSLFNLFPIYFLLILVSDIFFSLTPYGLGGHIGFLIAYLLFGAIRKTKPYEYGIMAIMGTAALLLFFFLGRLTPILGVDCFLGAILITNCVMCYLCYAKRKEKIYLLLSIALSLIFLSDVTIVLRTFVKTMAINHIFSFLTWPTYVFGAILLNFYYGRMKASLNKKPAIPD